MPRSRRSYRTLASLLDAQPKGLTGDPRHRLLWDRFMSSDRLQRLRISSRCYRLLDRASVPPENLRSFYRTYRLPEDPFFPLFLSVKAGWIAGREEWKRDREEYILSCIKNLPEWRRRALKTLGEFEEMYNLKGEHPLWDSLLYPTTKKRAEELIRADESAWYDIWRTHIQSLSRRYPGISFRTDEAAQPGSGDILLARLILRCGPGDSRDINRKYRSLSKEYHPDRGGDAAAFRHLKTARDILLEHQGSFGKRK